MPTATQLGEALLGLISLAVRERSRDLSLTAVSTLATLERCGPKPVTHLAVSEGITQPSMTTLVTQLEALGLAERRRDPTDGRVALVALTEQGLQSRHVARQGFLDRLSTLFAQLPAGQAKALEAAVPALEHLLDLADRSAVHANTRPIQESRK